MCALNPRPFLLHIAIHSILSFFRTSGASSNIEQLYYPIPDTSCQVFMICYLQRLHYKKGHIGGILPCEQTDYWYYSCSYKPGGVSRRNRWRDGWRFRSERCIATWKRSVWPGYPYTGNVALAAVGLSWKTTAPT